MIPKLEHITFAWEARAVFVPEDGSIGELAGYLPFGRGEADNMFFQLDETTLGALIESLEKARSMLEVVRKDLSSTNRVFPSPVPGSPDVDEDWIYDLAMSSEELVDALIGQGSVLVTALVLVYLIVKTVLEHMGSPLERQLGKVLDGFQTQVESFIKMQKDYQDRMADLQSKLMDKLVSPTSTRRP